MNYIPLLTQEEKVILCKLMTGKGFKELFKNHPQEFSEIRKGFRVKSLTEQFALSIAIANIDKPFIAKNVNMKVDIWLKEIQENINKLEEEGFSHSAAFSTVILDSFFVNHIELYFKLTGVSLDQQVCAYLYERMKDIQSERAKNAEISNQIRVIEEEKRYLSDELEAARQSVNHIMAEYEQKIQEIEQEKNALESSLTEARRKITELQTAPDTLKRDDAEDIVRFDDTNLSILPSADSSEIVSLCGVITDYNGQKRLVRYADLSHNGHYHIFRKREDAPPFFTNRDRIFYRSEFPTDGFHGIWTWSAVPNENDSSKDYILSRRNTDLDPIEVVHIKEAQCLDDLIGMLKKGIAYQPHSDRVMFSFFYAPHRQYMGILCYTKELQTVNGRTTFAEDCIVVPVYEFTGDDMIHLDNGLSFYRNAFAGLPSKLYHLKSSLEIVKSIVFSSFSWDTYKKRGLIRTQYRTFKDFLGAIPVDDITCQIETVCQCHKPAAKALLNEFLNIAWNYVDGDSLEDEIILSAISVNTALQEKTKRLIRADWETEHQSLLAEAQRKLDSLGAEIQSATARLIQAQEALHQTKLEEERLSAVIAEQEKLAYDVEKAVADRIQRAHENAAEFIANMAFVSGQQVQVSTGVEEPVPAVYHAYSGCEDLDERYAHHSWKDVITTVTCSLEGAGVAKHYTRGLAVFLCAAYLEKQPILLVGPNAMEIVQALSAAVTAKKYGVLYCEGNCVRQGIDQIGAEGEDIVIIHNLLASGWINRLPEILSQKDMFYVATHPYAEDIQAEPNSLYGFMLPLFTEFFVDKKPTGTYDEGYFADDFQVYSAPKDIRQSFKVLSEFALSSFVKHRIRTVAATMHRIHPDTTEEDVFFFTVLPMAYGSLEMGKLTQLIANPQKGISISETLKRDLKYVLGEV